MQRPKSSRDERMDEFRKQIEIDFNRFSDVKLKHIDMIFSQVIIKKTYCLIVFNLKHPSVEVVDNYSDFQKHISAHDEWVASLAVGGSVFMYCLTAWCIVKKGPVFVAMFGPLGVVIAALMGAFFLGDTLHVGSVVGSVIIVSGFYGVIWAQSKDTEIDDAGCAGHLPTSSSQKTPLLRDHSHI